MEKNMPAGALDPLHYVVHENPRAFIVNKLDLAWHAMSSPEEKEEEKKRHITGEENNITIYCASLSSVSSSYPIQTVHVIIFQLKV
jgi:hypothetical protein